MGEWQPIETLKITGHILVTDGERVAPVGAWDPSGRYYDDLTKWDDAGYELLDFAPTHWMPLPEPNDGSKSYVPLRPWLRHQEHCPQYADKERGCICGLNDALVADSVAFTSNVVESEHHSHDPQERFGVHGYYYNLSCDVQEALEECWLGQREGGRWAQMAQAAIDAVLRFNQRHQK